MNEINESRFNSIILSRYVNFSIIFSPFLLESFIVILFLLETVIKATAHIIMFLIEIVHGIMLYVTFLCCV